MTSPADLDRDLRQAFTESADAEPQPDLDLLWLDTRHALATTSGDARTRATRLRWGATAAAAAAAVVVTGALAVLDDDPARRGATSPPVNDPVQTAVVETHRGTVSEAWACDTRASLDRGQAARVLPSIDSPSAIPLEAEMSGVALVDAQVDGASATIRYGDATGGQLARTTLVRDDGGWTITGREYCTDPALTESPATPDPAALTVRGEPTIESGLGGGHRVVIDTRPYGTFAGTTAQQELQLAPNACESRTRWCAGLAVQGVSHGVAMLSRVPGQIPACRTFLFNGFSLHGRMVCGFFSDKPVVSAEVRTPGGSILQLHKVSPDGWPGETEYWAATTDDVEQSPGIVWGELAKVVYADGTQQHWMA